jgi:hypothetical protein
MQGGWHLVTWQAWLDGGSWNEMHQIDLVSFPSVYGAQRENSFSIFFKVVQRSHHNVWCISIQEPPIESQMWQGWSSYSSPPHYSLCLPHVSFYTSRSASCYPPLDISVLSTKFPAHQDSPCYVWCSLNWMPWCEMEGAAAWSVLRCTVHVHLKDICLRACHGVRLLGLMNV